MFKFILKLFVLAGLIGACFLFDGMAALGAPDDFILTWETDSYVPADYPGKALPIKESKIKAVLMPTKKLSYNPDLLNYRWFLDDEIMGWASGQGKSSFSFTATKESGYHLVEVQALGSDETIVFRRSLSIRLSRPQIMLHDAENGYSLQENYLTTSGKSIDFKAVPLFFHIGNISELAFQWRVDDINVPSEEKDADRLKLTIPKADLSSAVSKLIRVNAQNILNENEWAWASFYLEVR